MAHQLHCIGEGEGRFRESHAERRLSDSRNGRLEALKPGDRICENHLDSEGLARDNEDIGDFRYRHYTAGFPDTCPQVLLKLEGEELVAAFSASFEGVAELRHDVLTELGNLPEPCYEIWHRDHPVSSDHHIPDRWGATTRLLDLLRTRVRISPAPRNHDKVSSRREDRFGRNHMHVDSFYGMRTDAQGRRLKLDRYFFNLGTTTRDVLVAPLSPGGLDALVPKDYVPDAGREVRPWLAPLMDAVAWDIPLVCFRTPPPDLARGIVYGLKIRATHALHGEYGARGDFLAIVNSMPLDLC